MSKPSRPGDLASRNTATSYGLSLVAGLPLPPDATARIQRLTAPFADSPDRSRRYGPEHLHITLATLLRGRYRDAPPLRRAELPADLDAYAAGLAEVCAAVAPFQVELGEARLGTGGGLWVEVRGGENARAALRAFARRFRELDAPDNERESWHVSVGYLLRPAEREEFSRFAAPVPPAVLDVSQVWLVHYASRTLDRLMGRIPLALGRPNRLTAEELLARLRIDA